MYGLGYNLDDFFMKASGHPGGGGWAQGDQISL
jgi:hypothetical protein